MSEYISREAAIDAMTEQNLVVHMDSVYDGLVASCHRSAQRIIANIPAADVRPVVRGKWNETKRVTNESGWESIHWECSSCGIEIETVSQIHDISAWHFCPNCGADMRAKGEA